MAAANIPLDMVIDGTLTLNNLDAIGPATFTDTAHFADAVTVDGGLTCNRITSGFNHFGAKDIPDDGAGVTLGPGDLDASTRTAAQLVEDNPDVEEGDSFDFFILNLAAGPNVTITLVGGAGVTIVGDDEVPANSTAGFRVLFRDVSAGNEDVFIFRLTA